MDLPVSFVSVRSLASKPQIGLGALSLWTTVHVSADVSSIPLPGASVLAPLDVIILLDSLWVDCLDLLFADAQADLLYQNPALCQSSDPDYPWILRFGFKPHSQSGQNWSCLY
jgi:hypothetical protein